MHPCIGARLFHVVEYTEIMRLLLFKIVEIKETHSVTAQQNSFPNFPLCFLFIPQMKVSSLLLFLLYVLH